MSGKFRITIFLSCAAIILCCSRSASAQPAAQQEQKLISVSSSGTVKAKPDLALILMEVRATAPLAADALQENTRKVGAIGAKLKEMGFKESEVRFSGSQFTPAGGGRYVMAGGPRVTGFDVYNVIQIRLAGIDPERPEVLNEKVAAVLDELSKVGASILSPDISRMSLGGSSTVVFTVQDPEKYEREAFELAVERARPIAEQIARKMGVKISAMESIQSTPGPQRATYGSEPVDLTYVSTSPDQVLIKMNAFVRFSYK